MAIKRYRAEKDNTITNAFKLTSTTRGTGSNMGAADILETFSLYGQGPATSSAELSRALLQFPVTQISADRTAGTIPISGNVDFYLRVFNARHSEQLPRDFTMNVLAVSSSWQEGYGLDMESYTDITKDSIDGSNWMNASSNFVAAKLANAIDCTGVNNDHTFTLTSPTAMGGDGVTYTFKFVHDTTAINAGAAGNIYYIARDGLTDAQRAGACADAINGTANANVAFSDGNANSVNTTDLKIKATAPGTDGGATIDLEFDNKGALGNGHVNVLAATNGFTGTKILEGAFSGGDGQWANVGGDYHTSHKEMPNYTFTFPEGHEDIELDVTEMVEEWIDGTHGYQENYGLGIHLSSSFEAYTTASESTVLLNTAGQRTSFYTKRFFSRSSEFFFKRPIIEARWDSRIKDNRGNFFYSSSLAPAEENLNTIYLYNYVRGQLKNIPGVESNNHIYVNIYSGSTDNSGPTGDPLVLTKDTVHVKDSNKLTITGGFVSTGIYSASFALTASSEPLEKLFDVWYTGSADHSTTTQFFTGSIVPKFDAAPVSNAYPQYVTKITNLKSYYNSNEQARFRVFTRPRNFSPTIYTVAKKKNEGVIIPSASYEIIRTIDNHTVINNSTGSSAYHTYLSYDVSGSYFDLDMSMLESGYMYSIKFAYNVSDGWREQEELFNFRVEDN